MCRRVLKFFVVLAMWVMSLSVVKAVDEPKKLFEIETGKRIEAVNFVRDESIITIKYKTQLWAYDNLTGKKLWETKVKDGAEEGFHLIWNDKLYIMPKKKGMIAFDLETGNKVWETDVDIKMKEFVTSHDFADIFLLEFEDNLMAFDPATGKVLWTADLNYSKNAQKADATVLWSITRDWGGRILVLGKEGPYLLDAKDGKILWKSEKREFSDEIEEPVIFSGDEAVMLLYKKGASGLNMKEGKEVWYIDQEFEDAKGMVEFTGENGKKYALFSFKDFIIMFDAETGNQMWRSGEDLQGRIYNIQLLGKDILMTLTRNSFKLEGNPGGYLMLYKVKFEDGTVIWKTTLGYSTDPHVSFKIPLIGIKMRQNSVWYRGPINTPYGLFYQIWGRSTCKVGEPTQKWRENKDGEGLVMVNPDTGNVVWRCYFNLYKYVEKEYQRIVADKSKITGKAEMFHPGYPELVSMIAEPVIDGDSVYIPGNEGILRVNLPDGKVLWESPKYGFVPTIYLTGGYTYGRQGWAQWSYHAEIKVGEFGTARGKAKDIIIDTKKHGYFCLNANNGKEVWSIKDSKEPYDIFGAIIGTDEKSIFICDGKILRRLDFKPETKGFSWKIDLGKSKIGEISAEKGVVFKQVYYDRTTGQTHTILTGRARVHHSMEHGLWSLPNKDILVIAEEGPARITPDGKIAWKLDWEWKPHEINLTPKIVQEQKYIVYQYKDKLYCVDLETGKIKWMTKEHFRNPFFLFDSKEKNLYVADLEVLYAYKIAD